MCLGCCCFLLIFCCFHLRFHPLLDPQEVSATAPRYEGMDAPSGPCTSSSTASTSASSSSRTSSSGEAVIARCSSSSDGALNHRSSTGPEDLTSSSRHMSDEVTNSASSSNCFTFAANGGQEKLSPRAQQSQLAGFEEIRKAFALAVANGEVKEDCAEVSRGLGLWIW